MLQCYIAVNKSSPQKDKMERNRMTTSNQLFKTFEAGDNKRSIKSLSKVKKIYYYNLQTATEISHHSN